MFVMFMRRYAFSCLVLNGTGPESEKRLMSTLHSCDNNPITLCDNFHTEETQNSQAVFLFFQVIKRNLTLDNDRYRVPWPQIALNSLSSH